MRTRGGNRLFFFHRARDTDFFRNVKCVLSICNTSIKSLKMGEKYGLKFCTDLFPTKFISPIFHPSLVVQITILSRCFWFFSIHLFFSQRIFSELALFEILFSVGNSWEISTGNFVEVLDLEVAQACPHAQQEYWLASFKVGAGDKLLYLRLCCKIAVVNSCPSFSPLNPLLPLILRA